MHPPLLPCSRVTASPGNSGKPKVSSEPAGRAPAINRLLQGQTHTHTPSFTPMSRLGPQFLSLGLASLLIPPSHTTLLPPLLGLSTSPETRHPGTKQCSPPRLWEIWDCYMYFTAQTQLSIKHSVFLSLFFPFPFSERFLQR